MKKVYVPSIEELNELKKIILKSNIAIINQDKNFDLYSYCLAKKIEIILANGGLEFFGSDEKNDYSIVSNVIKYYPSDIWCTPYKNDPDLAKNIIIDNKPKYNFGLDNAQFIGPELLDDCSFVSEVINTLLENLRIDPYYRFEYIDSTILNNIFLKKISPKYMEFTSYYKPLLEIEPAYILDTSKNKFLEEWFNCYYDNNDEITELHQANALAYAIHEYASRYGVNYSDVNSYDEKEKKYKKLVLFLQEHKN